MSLDEQLKGWQRFAVETALFLDFFLPIGGSSSITQMGYYGFYRYISEVTILFLFSIMIN